MSFQLKSVSFQNFMSFGNKETTVNLDVKQNALILGKNLDIGADGESANGVGKTTVFRAIMYGLYGDGIDKLKDDEYINITNGKKMIVTVIFEKNNKTYTVKRYRKPNKLEFYCKTVVDDVETEENITLDSMKNTNNLITSVIGIPFDVFMRVYFLSPHIESFASLTAANQRDFIESLLDLDVLTKRADSLKLIKKDLAVDVKLVENDISTVEHMNQKIIQNKKRIEEKVSEFDASTKRKIEDTEEDISKIQEDIETVEEVLSKKDEIILGFDELNQEKERLKLLKSELSSYEKDLPVKKMQYDKIVKDIEEYERLIEQRDSFDRTKQDKINSIKENIDKFLSSDAYEEIASHIKEKQELELRLKDIKRSNVAIEKDLSRIVTETEKLEDEVKSLESGTCPYCNQSHYDKDKLLEIKEKIKSNTSKFDEKENELISDDEVTKIEDRLTELASLIVVSNPEAELRKLNNLNNDLTVAMNSENSYVSIVDEFEKTKINGVTDDLAKLENEIELIEKEISTYNSEIKHCEEFLINKKKELIAYGVEDVNEIKHIEKDFNNLKESIENKRKELNDLLTTPNPYIEELEKTEEQIQDVGELNTKLEELKKDEEHIGYLVKLLTDPKSFIRKNIVDQYIPFVNKKINENTQFLGLSHTICINSDMSVDITYLNRSVSYFNLSQGERLRMNVSVTMAFRELMRILGKSCNVLMVDEMFDSALDTSGMHSMFKFVKDSAENLMIVSHREEFIPSVDSKIVITKKDGFSSIESELV